MLDNILDGDDGIGTFGNDAARRDRHRLAGLERARRGQSCSDPSDDRQRAGRVGRANGEAVHRRARERRQVDRRTSILGEHASGGRAERHRLRRQAAGPRENRRERLFDREQARQGRRILGAVISVVVPVYNEERSVGLLYEELQAALDPLPDEWEVVYVDDGSTDESFAALTRLHSRAANVRVVRLRRNFGKAAALAAGFAEATGDVVVTIDGDLQDDPSEIPHLLAKLDEGFDLVSGWKTRRRDPLTRRIPSKLFNWVAGRMSGLHLHDMNCGLKAYRRRRRARPRPLRRAAPLHPGARPRAGLSHRRASREPPPARARTLAVRARALPPRLPRPAHRLVHGALPAPAAAPLRRPRASAHGRGNRRPRLPDGGEDHRATRSGNGRC